MSDRKLLKNIPGEPDLNDRADQAHRAVQYYIQKTGGDFKNEPETVIQDLITDLCHLAEQYSHEPVEIAQKAIRMYEAEKWEASQHD